MLDSPERVCAGQAWFEYPATFVLFSTSIRGLICLPLGHPHNGDFSPLSPCPSSGIHASKAR
jgi:hypothetical protein